MGAIQFCAREHPDHGTRVTCELPSGHDGAHRALDPSRPSTLRNVAGELYWIWTDDREPDSR